MQVKIKSWGTAGVVAVVVVIAAGVGVYLVRGDAGREDDLPEAVRAALTVRARDVIESGVASGLSGGDGRLACAVHVLGADPPALTAADQARSVYVWALCETVGTEVASGSSLPVAVRLTDPPTGETPGDGLLYGPDIERIFPERLRDPVLDADYVSELEPLLRERIRTRT
jgi:hypothetical protein